MPRKLSTQDSRWLHFAIASLLVFAATSTGQVTDRPVLGQGEIVGDDVYVRSGDSLNHYPVTKMNAGDRVTLVGERGEWYEILPPAGTFTWVSAEYVDSPDNKTGVINGNNVRARAGSSLPEWSKNKYAIQAMLEKGTEVTILASHPDGFLQIEPPPGATLWIHRKFVERVDGSGYPVHARTKPTGEVTRPSSDAATPSAADELLEDSPVERPAVSSAEPTSTFGTLPPSQHRQELEKIDEATRAELKKPVFERDFGDMRSRYDAIAGQNEDDIARQYAVARIQQVDHMRELIDAARATQKLDEVTEAERRKLLEERMAIPQVPLPEPGGLDAQGELRVSALYPPGSEPRRFRLVDPSSPNGRTLGYVEIPLSANINVQDFVGRFVGVRASDQKLQQGGVDPVPIYVASELVVLEPGKPVLTSEVRVTRPEPPPEPMYLVP